MELNDKQTVALNEAWKLLDIVVESNDMISNDNLEIILSAMRKISSVL